jgi:hypothetical protein
MLKSGRGKSLFYFDLLPMKIEHSEKYQNTYSNPVEELWPTVEGSITVQIRTLPIQETNR